MFSTDIPIKNDINRKLFFGGFTILSRLLKSLLSCKWRWLYYADSVYINMEGACSSGDSSLNRDRKICRVINKQRGNANIKLAPSSYFTELLQLYLENCIKQVGQKYFK